MNNSYLKLGKINTLPVASSLYRGKIITVLGDSNTEDQVYICKKKADGSYAWFVIKHINKLYFK
jgi:hypothetical protein